MRGTLRAVGLNELVCVAWLAASSTFESLLFNLFQGLEEFLVLNETRE